MTPASLIADSPRMSTPCAGFEQLNFEFGDPSVLEAHVAACCLEAFAQRLVVLGQLAVCNRSRSASRTASLPLTLAVALICSISQAVSA